MTTTIVIPARLESKRLRRKLLLKDTGKTVLQHTWEAACKTQQADKVVIAADDPELTEVASAFGAEVYLTNPNHKSGTERIAELVRGNLEGDLIVNWQADEPLLPPEDVDRLIQIMLDRPALQIATLAAPLTEDLLCSHSTVKVAISQYGNALYFSRAPLAEAKHHIGVYAFRRKILLQDFPHSRLAEAESLEQLVWLDYGYYIGTVQVQDAPLSIDTAHDYERFVKIVQATRPANGLAATARPASR